MDGARAGKVKSMLTGDYTPPRWDQTSVFDLYLRGTEVRKILALDLVERRELTELLHWGVSMCKCGGGPCVLVVV